MRKEGALAGQLRYIAQGFWGAELKPGEPMPFVCAVDAEEGARILARLARGAIAYQQIIDPVGPVFGDPEILGSWGHVPPAALAIDGDPWSDLYAA